MHSLWIAAAVAALPSADVEALLERFECARCHEVPGAKAVPTARHCVRCHEDIHAGRMTAPPEALARWRENVRSLNAAPDLRQAGRRLSRAWVQAFLLDPSDQRPALPASMPRLDLTEAEAATLARHLVPEPPPAFTPDPSRIERGAALYARLDCGACHAFTGVTPPPPPQDGLTPPARLLAPDLGLARARVPPGRLVQWLLDPAPPMPKVVTRREDAEALAAFVLLAELSPPPEPAAPRRLPVLERKVSFDEVWTKVLKTVCWHCHSAADLARGDGGPGNTGGFGFPARGLDVSSYAALARGVIDPETGRRKSVFAEVDGEPRLLRVLLARRGELRGEVDPRVRGMPLGFPPLSPEQIQLVESWIAQGRPR